MLNSLPLFIALRHIRGKQGSGFATFISWLSFAAMALGVATLIIVMSVMNGFNREIRSRLLQVIPHAVVDTRAAKTDGQSIREKLSDLKIVVAATPVVEGFGMLSYRGVNRGVSIQGINPATETGVTNLGEHMKTGQLDSLEPGKFGIILGNLLARDLGVEVGEKVLLSLPELNITPAGVFPRFKRFTVVGVFSVGAQVDDGLAFLNIADAQKIYRLGNDVHGVRIKSTEPLKPELLRTSIADKLNHQYPVLTWKDSMQSLFAAIQMEKLVVGVLLSSVIVVAAFNIIASLILMVASKRKDLAVLRTLGADLPMVYRLIVYQGGILGVGGVITGILSGSFIAINIGSIVGILEHIFGFNLFDPSVYFIGGLPSELKLMDTLVIGLVGVLLSILASLYPAKRAGQILPAEALRYDH